VVYDRIGTYASPRAWWMFKAMGHGQIAVLDGGLPAWIEGGPALPAGRRAASRAGGLRRAAVPGAVL
jgi:thiosulfate/3-mercaptopyruvate sulfurtransferase